MQRYQKSVELRGRATLRYVEQGDPTAVPVVLIHGFTDSWRSFERVLPHLPKWMRVLALTQRGHGDASRPESGYALPDLAADVAAFLGALGTDGAIIVGHSMGSAVAQRFAIDHPERTRGLVLVGAAASARGTPEARAHWDATLAKLGDPVSPSFVRELVERSLAKPVPAEVLDVLVEESVKVPLRVWRATLDARWRSEGDFSTELGKITAPTLIVWGERDVRYPRSEQEAIARAIAGSRLVVFPGAGHHLHIEEPERFAAELASFVADINGDVRS